MRALQAAAVCGKPVYVFRELMHYLAAEHVAAPGYSTMQDIVGRALVQEQRRLAGIVDSLSAAVLMTDLPPVRLQGLINARLCLDLSRCLTFLPSTRKITISAMLVA